MKIFLTKQNILILITPVLMAAMLVLVFVVPIKGVIAQSSVIMDIPVEGSLEGWYGVKRQETDRERATLAPDTTFSKAVYYRLDLREMANDFACSLSIVLSGDAMNSSIHRPEYCLPTQGHFNLAAQTKNILLDNGRTITFTRLSSQLDISADAKQPQLVNCVSYYVFVGYRTVTSSHIMRTLHDFKRRVFQGQDQRWAYIQINCFYGDAIGTTEEQTEDCLQSLIKVLVPKIVKWDEV